MTVHELIEDTCGDCLVGITRNSFDPPGRWQHDDGGAAHKLFEALQDAIHEAGGPPPWTRGQARKYARIAVEVMARHSGQIGANDA